MTETPRDELERLREEVAESRREYVRQEGVIDRLRARNVRLDELLADLEHRLAGAEDELLDLRAVRDALVPPDLPERPGLELAAAFEPAAQGVGGDFHLVTEGPEDTTVIVVGDVVGKGAIAARRAAFARTVCSAASTYEDDPAGVLNVVNAALIERSGPGTDFITAACVAFHPQTQTIGWACAGHPVPIDLGTGHSLRGAHQGMPLGIAADLGLTSSSRTLRAGEGLLLYTDGLTEARRGGEQFGVEGVQAALEDTEGRDPAAVVANLGRRAREFAGGELQDDLCVVALRAT